MPAASLMRLASSSFSLKTARSRAIQSAARGVAVERGVRPRRAIRAALAQTMRAGRGLPIVG
ncbi:MAG: hypothetical protein AB7G13_24575 [Lautropia sp.]